MMPWPYILEQNITVEGASGSRGSCALGKLEAENLGPRGQVKVNQRSRDTLRSPASTS